MPKACSDRHPQTADAGVHDGMGRERSRQAWLEPLSTEERSEDVRGDNSPPPGKEVTERGGRSFRETNVER